MRGRGRSRSPEVRERAIPYFGETWIVTLPVLAQNYIKLRIRGAFWFQKPTEETQTLLTDLGLTSHGSSVARPRHRAWTSAPPALRETVSRTRLAPRLLRITFASRVTDEHRFPSLA